MVTGASIWGLSSIYYKALLAVPALEVIAHRTLWSMVFFGLLIAFQGRLGIGLGATPWISLLLASTFSIYGLLKRRVEIGPVASVFLEVLLVAPIALVFLGWIHSHGGGAFGDSVGMSLLLIGAGPLTAVPLILFSYGAQRLDFATVGIVQYVNPTLQFLVAVFLFGEVFTDWHGIALPMIWVAT